MNTVDRGGWHLVGVRGVLSLWCLSALLLFKPFAGQRKRGLRFWGCHYTTDTSDNQAASFST